MTEPLDIDGEHATMTFVRHLPYPIEAVWAAITDPDRRAAWFGETSLEPRQGGRIEMVATDPPAPVEQKRMTGRILVWDPPKGFIPGTHAFLDRLAAALAGAEPPAWEARYAELAPSYPSWG